jgi:hypothetical protein
MPIAWQNGADLPHPARVNVVVHDDSPLVEIQQHGIEGVGLHEGVLPGGPTGLTQYATVAQLRELIDLYRQAVVAAEHFHP